MQGATAFGKDDPTAATEPRTDADTAARTRLRRPVARRSQAAARRRRFLYHFLDGFSALVDVFDVGSPMRARPRPVTVRQAAADVGRMLSEATAEVGRDVERRTGR